MSPFTLHRNYRLRRTHVADIKERLVRALWYYRYAQRVSRDAGSMPSDPEAREQWDDLVAEVKYAISQCNRILADLRSSRQLGRLSEGYDIPGIIASEREVA
ncbi:MAG TPA: hypothetical protein VEC60_12405 [Reyranella sp.]|nr:hypothetical protein [Reyranella sp.]